MPLIRMHVTTESARTAKGRCGYETMQVRGDERDEVAPIGTRARATGWSRVVPELACDFTLPTAYLNNNA